MIAVHFDKAYAERVLDAIKTGKPISPPGPHRWTGNDQLTLAGILFAGVYSHGPHTHQIRGVSPAAARAMNDEQREAVGDTLRQDILNGIEYVSSLTFAVLDDEYDVTFEPVVSAVLHESDGKKQLYPGAGFKAT